ncbi:MAG: SigE family RNA polymerase sigma factor [Acidimicrobiia bacterium]|nr:MAG: SigE family RNA polymerase sigma factor [Acidimicrobiia bacterium]
MLPDEVRSSSFTEFVEDSELRLRQALMASFGPEAGRDAAAEALAYGWEHWDRVSEMVNPVGYLYRVGQTRGRRLIKWRQMVLPAVTVGTMPWVEPGLPDAMRRLPQKQRQVVFLLHAYDWSMSEVAELMGVSKATVQSYSDRAMGRLRRSLKVK